MTATLREIPSAPLIHKLNWRDRNILGKRVRHRHLGAQGRLTGKLRYERSALWLEVETNGGTFFWLARSVDELGPIPMPTMGRAG